MIVKRVVFALMLPMLLAPAARAADPQESAIRKSVVKVFATKRRPEMLRPWRKRDPEEVSGTGVVIAGKRILTNAHIAGHASQVFVQPDQSSEKLVATVEVCAPGIDLAVLKLADTTFFDKHPPLERSKELPEVKEAVLVYGYPEGGESLSITRGIVSRIEYDDYYYLTKGLRIQVDAAINPGNSGGPALVNNKMVGIIFSHLVQSENIGYIIPEEEIELFLADLADGKYDGKPVLWDAVQTIENDAIIAMLKLGQPTAGVMISEAYERPDPNPLKAWDVITHIGDKPIDNTSMVQVREHLRLDFHYFVQKLTHDGKVRLSLLREGKPLELDVPVELHREYLLPFMDNRYPTYFIWGPLVFAPATYDFVHSFESEESASAWYPYMSRRKSPLIDRMGDRPRFPGEELVVVSARMFPHRTSKGYSDPFAQVVDKVNGVKIRNIRHFVETVRDATGEYVTIAFADREAEILVFNRKEARDATEEILTENGIRKQCSEDLQAIWEPKP